MTIKIISIERHDSVFNLKVEYAHGEITLEKEFTFSVLDKASIIEQLKITADNIILTFKTFNEIQSSEIGVLYNYNPTTRGLERVV